MDGEESKIKGGRDSTTYYFTRFLENFNAKAMYNIFKKYKEKHEVVISIKRNKQGKRFVFVTFGRVHNVRRFGVQYFLFFLN